jgi:predicted RNA-binding protein with TRAM domain
MYAVTASAGPNGSISPSGSVSVVYGGSQTFTITPAAGYHIADVLVDGASVGAVTTYAFTTVTASHAIAAVFEENPSYSITAPDDLQVAGLHGTISPSGISIVLGGTDKAFTIIPDPGYRVADVLVDGVSVGARNDYTFSNIQADHTINAFFTADVHAITAGADVNGSITPSGTITVNNGDSLTFTITPDTGYEVLNVIVDGASMGAVTTYTFTNIVANHAINAYFQ